MRVVTALALVLCSILTAPTLAAGSSPDLPVGVSAVDITPDYPIRLSGFGFRRAESEGVNQRIWAKALAFGADAANANEPGPAVLVTVDSTGVPGHIRKTVADRLAAKAKLNPDRFAITSSHTHTAPMVSGVLATLFGQPIPPEHQAHIDRYTKELTDHIEKVALAALADRKPARLEFGVGKGDLAMNRRNKNGPTDHDLPVLTVRSPDGALRAIYLSYACHCVTLSHNKIGGDWAGYLQDTLQQEHPGAVALTSIGCGADQNPKSGVTGDKIDVAAEQGKTLAAEVARLLKEAGSLKPLAGPVAAKAAEIELMFDTPPTREEFEKRVAENKEYIGYHAKAQLARLDRGEKLQTKLPYLIQTWTFGGDDLAMVFLPGEVVVDYSVRLKRDFDATRLWINAYANDVPCYIPSERVLKEAGYEGASAMTYYDRPTKLATGLEQKIVDEVHRQVPEAFLARPGTEGVAPRSAVDSLKAIRTKPGLEVELVAAEPLVTSPVAIDWGADGRLWVCEMFDYPTGLDGNWQPGGRIKFLTDADGDGRYDTAAVFLDKIPFPTGVTAWGRGVLVCAARPDILYAEDTNGDGKADKIEKLFTGFVTENYQARVNSLAIGLDNWVYGANGLLGGVISPGNAPETKLDIRNRDFRFRPGAGGGMAGGAGPMETVNGLTQQGRVRDDFGRWYGCDNSTPLWHFPHEERYLRRNPHAPAPPPAVRPPVDGGADAGRIFPISRMLERFNNPDSANRFTSGCGLGLYRDALLGDAYAGNAFACEPVHNVVTRMMLTDDADGGPGVRRKRADDERESEFLASTDNWFRPVQAKTGPDGALYVVDMYRFLIEHPRWIPAERLAKLDARAGADMGRIYRVRATGKPLHAVRDLTKLNAAELAAAIDSPNGTERDRVHIELLSRNNIPAAEAAPALAKIAGAAASPQARVQALSAQDGVGGLSAEALKAALADKDAHVRAHAVRLCEGQLKRDAGAIADALLAVADDPSPAVRHQLAYTLGEWDDARAGAALARLATKHLADDEMRIAVLSSAGGRHCGDVLAAITALPADANGRGKWLTPLVATAAASTDAKLFGQALVAVLPAESAQPTPGHFDALAGLLDALERRSATLAAYPDVAPRLAKTLDAARATAARDDAAPAARASAMKLLGRGGSETPAAELDLLCILAARAPDAAVRDAAVAALRRQQTPAVADRLLKDWKQTGPAARTPLINLLLARDEWATRLLDAVKRNVVGRNEVALTDRQRLLAESTPAELRKLAAEVFPPEPASARADVLKQYESVRTIAGDASRGAAAFAQHCAACHALDGVGHAVGPDLSILRDRDADYFVKNVLDPSAIVEPRFSAYLVVTKDRRTLSGLIKSETAAGFVLESGGGATETVARADVKDIRASKISMMPEGLEAALPPAAMADLVAFLKSGGGGKPKTFAGNAPKLVTPDKAGMLLLAASAAEIRGDQIAFESELGNVGYWHGQGDHAAWAVRVEKPGAYDVYLDYACASDAAGNGFAVVAGTDGAKPLGGKVAATGSDWSQYKQAKVGTLTLAAGEQHVVVRPAGDAPVRGALMDLRTVALVPAGAKPTWPMTVVKRDNLARDPASLVRVILDPGTSAAAKEAAINANPQFSTQLITLMTEDLPVGAPAALEYERIPWIWRVSIAAGRRNGAAELKSLIAVSLPELDAPLRDWQAVVIGGGVINGISQRGTWPGPRIAEALAGDEALLKRWQRSIDLAAKMADDEKVKSGTRYDALRMLGVESWEKRGAHLARYLAKGTNGELQMGAVSGLADVDAPEATAALVASLPDLAPRNLELALDALLRDDARAAALLRAVADGKVSRDAIGKERAERLLTHANAEVRKAAEAVIK